ncbi:hypothetical protein GLOTRDRAFT_125857 [Gloeophyllum trabeum ATCC 11539]|uniref:Uncharacterized protein n=1 Tax=Gloeophyllum trabeum (strain ATCC 11539 / FP-39264 / Madison 617) TaxID=670483 RepID=S7S1E0_GLOTA|nr:uncharacterized protein GLOTRDRAFT_125857 [Gloeophyllum trabeum ATCC 11539]EPQ59554.1 hypothetical protein GLOTRDRAFT_125857 [Gloeophyllum trabeum ATCC 11539]
MPDWSSVAEITKDSEVFIRLIFALFGLYCWELFSTCTFEWSLIQKKRQFKWPLVRVISLPTIVFFFLCRYCILWALIGLIISFSVESEVNCNALYTFNSFCGNMAILAASTTLMLRTIALWERSLKVVIPVGILCLGHWGLLWYGMFIVSATWDPQAGACAVDKTNHIFLSINLLYTMAFDLTVLVLTMTSLFRSEGRSGLWKMLFKDGLVYFLVTAGANTLPAILNLLNLNINVGCPFVESHKRLSPAALPQSPPQPSRKSDNLSDLAPILTPGALPRSIAACRAVIRLQDYAKKDPYVHSASLIANEVRLSRYGASVKAPRYNITRPEIHVTTDQIVMEDMSPVSPTAVGSQYDGRPFDGTNGTLKMKGSEGSLDSSSSHGIHVQFASTKEADEFAAHAV